MNRYFILLHKKIVEFASTTRGLGDMGQFMSFTQAEFYRSLFSWQAEISDVKSKAQGLDDSQISRWLNGKEAIPEWIASLAVHNIERCYQEYIKIFSSFIDRSLFQSQIIEEQLQSCILSLLNNWNFAFLGMSETRDLQEILAIALTTALIADFSLKTNQLDSELQSKLLKTVQLCKEHNVAFKTPYILSVIMEDNESLLWRTLNSISPGEGNRFGEGVLHYRNSTKHSNSYEEVYLDQETLLVQARILSCAFGKQVTDELDLCYALQSFHSATTTTLQSIVGEYWEHPGLIDLTKNTKDKWRQKLEDCQKLEQQKQHTSTLHFLHSE